MTALQDFPDLRRTCENFRCACANSEVRANCGLSSTDRNLAVFAKAAVQKDAPRTFHFAVQAHCNTFLAACSTRRLAVLVIATIWLTGCATDGFESGRHAVCPPVVEYNREFQTRAAEELKPLPDGSAIAEMLSDYAVKRDQARVCTGP